MKDIQTYLCPINIQEGNRDQRRQDRALITLMKLVSGYHQRNAGGKPKPGEKKPEPKPDKKKPKPKREGGREPREPRQPKG